MDTLFHKCPCVWFTKNFMKERHVYEQSLQNATTGPLWPTKKLLVKLRCCVPEVGARGRFCLLSQILALGDTCSLGGLDCGRPCDAHWLEMYQNSWCSIPAWHFRLVVHKKMKQMQILWAIEQLLDEIKVETKAKGVLEGNKHDATSSPSLGSPLVGGKGEVVLSEASSGTTDWIFCRNFWNFLWLLKVDFLFLVLNLFWHGLSLNHLGQVWTN